MNRRMMEKALSQIDDRFVQESLEKMTAENKGKSKAGKYEAPGSGGLGRKFLILVLAACLVFTLAAVAYAANVWGIREMFRTELRELPEAVVEDIQVHTETAAAEDWSARVTESYCDGSKILMTVEVSGGDRYVLAPTYVEPQSSIGEIGLSGEQTLEDYAREQGKELLFVGASLMQNEGLGIFTEAQNNWSPTVPTQTRWRVPCAGSTPGWRTERGKNWKFPSIWALPQFREKRYMFPLTRTPFPASPWAMPR